MVCDMIEKNPMYLRPNAIYEFDSSPPRTPKTRVKRNGRSPRVAGESNQFQGDQRPYFWNSQSLLSSGQTCRAFSHLEMQWKWKACCSMYVVSNTTQYRKVWGCAGRTLQMPQATVHSSLVAEAWFA